MREQSAHCPPVRTLLGGILAASLLSVGIVPSIVLAEDTEQMIRDAVSFHDQQQYAKSVELLKRVLELEPRNDRAAYELAYTHQAAGDLESCVDVAGQALTRIRHEAGQSAIVPQLYVLLASCHSSAGDTERAIGVFRTALEDYPDDYGLNFNIAITLTNDGQHAEAIEYLKRAMDADPVHPSPYYIAGINYGQREQGAMAVLAFLVFLQREFNTDRCTAAAQAVFDIAFSRIETDPSSGKTTLYVDPQTDSDSQGTLTLTLGLSMAALAAAPDGRVEEPVEKSLAGLLQSFVKLAAEFQPEPDTDTLLASHLLPAVRRLEKEDVTEAFAYYVVRTAGVASADDWMDKHGSDVDALVGYFNRLAEVPQN